MTRVDEDQRFREERAEQLRERDRQREPRSFRRLARDLAARNALRITLVERAGAAQDEGAVDVASVEARSNDV
jgi:hypothetical protein